MSQDMIVASTVILLLILMGEVVVEVHGTEDKKLQFRKVSSESDQS